MSQEFLILMREYLSSIRAFFLCFLYLLLIGQNSYSFDLTDRFQLLEDRNFIQRRITNETSLDGAYLNLSSHISSFGVLLDLNSLADSPSGFINLFEDVRSKELATFFNFEVIVPFRGIQLEEFELRPKFYLRLDFGVLSNGFSKIFSKKEFDAWLLNYYSSDSDREIIREILNFVNALPDASENVFQHFIDEGGCNTSTLLNFCQEKRDAANAPIMPTDSDQKIVMYTKAQYKLGVLWDFMIVDDWTGYINIYGLQRGDSVVALDDDSALEAENKPLDQLFQADNSQQFVMIDAKFQLNMRPFKFHFLMEELKITRWNDNINESGDLFYRNTTLYKFYASYTSRIRDMIVMPFGGFHKRRGYELLDGIFVGLDLNNVKTSSRFRIMIDSENVSFMPSARIGHTDFIYQVHLPFRSISEQGISREAMHSLKLSIEI